MGILKSVVVVCQALASEKGETPLCACVLWYEETYIDTPIAHEIV